MAKPADRRPQGGTRSRVPLVMLCALLLATVTAAAGASASADLLSYDDARHLLARTGFGPREAEVRSYTGLSRDAAVERLLATARTTAVTALPGPLLAQGPLRPRGAPDATPEDRKAFVQEQVEQGLLLRGWWIEEMLMTPSPLTERMTLFWHNHFVSAQPKVRVTRLMATQNATLRAHALGNFGTLLHAIAHDPAMILYLDGAQNRKGAPNENFAREVMELFTLGEGRYAEADVKEAARAFTGWSLDRETGSFMFRRFLHDDGVKTIFGKSGRFDGDDVLDLLLARPETAEFITTKLWREFVSPDPDAREIARIARRFRDSRYDIKVALGELLRSDAFFAPENRGMLVKSPVELVVGTLRQLQIAPEAGLPFALAVAGMGQNLFSAPNVKGWPGGEAWINSNTLLARKQFLDRLTRGDDPAALVLLGALAGTPSMKDGQRAAVPRQVIAPNGLSETDKPRMQRFARDMQRALASVHFDSARWMAQFPGGKSSERNAAAMHLLLATAPQRSIDPDSDSLTLVRSVLLDAAYQLK